MAAAGVRRLGWGRRLAAVVGTVLTLGSIPAGPTSAQVAPTAFVGYEASASGTALSAFPTVPALLPVDVPLEATLSLATATISSGGQAFGRASTFYPGSLAAGLRPLIEQAAGVRVPLPDYPIIVEAREFEEAKRSEIPGVTMTADADPDRSIATAGTGSLGIPIVLGIRSLHTESRAELEGGLVTGTSTTVLNGIDIAGALRIGTLVSTARVTSDGTASTCSGEVTISGATLAGTPVVIDDEGIHVDRERVAPGLGLGAILEQTLSALGLDVRALGGADSCTGTFGSRTSTGLLVRLPLPALGPIPAGGGVTFVLASTTASAGGSLLPPDDAAPGSDGSDLGSVLTSGPVTGGGGTFVPPLAPPATSGAPVSSGGGFAVERAAYDFDGVPLSLVAGLAALVVVASGWVRRYMDRIVGMVGPP